MNMRGHDLVVHTDGDDDLPLVRGLTIDGHEFLVPAESIIDVGADARGAMTATVTFFVRSFRSEPAPSGAT